MKPISSTFLFNLTDEVVDYRNVFQQMQLKQNHLPKKELEYFIDLIDRRFNFAMKPAVVSCFTDENSIIPVFNKTTIFLPTYVPCVGSFDEKTNKVVVYVNLTPYGVISKNGKFDIDAKKLYTLLQMAYILKEFASLNWNKITLNLNIMKTASYIYSLMFSKLVDKLYATRMVPIQHDTVLYLSSKFFIKNVLDRNVQGEKLIESIAMSNTSGVMNSNTIVNDVFFREETYSDLNAFLQSLNELHFVKKLNTRIFLQEWIKLYGEASFMGLEYFPFFLHMLFSTYVSANIVNDFIIEPLAPKELTQLYVEISKIIK